MRVGTPAFSAFVEHLQPQLMRFFKRRVSNPDEARDLCQETWLRMAEHAPAASWESDERARAYVFTVADHLLIDVARRRGVESVAISDLHIRAQHQSSSDVVDHLSYRQAIAAVDSVLLSLPERKRMAFIRHRLHGELQASIAATLDVSTNTIERDIMQVDALLEEALHRWHGSAPEATNESSSQTLSKQGKRRRSVSALLGLAVLAGTGLPAWRLWQQRVQWHTVLASQVGKLLSQTLPDGSAIDLDADSRLSVNYHAHMRHAWLEQGAAFFSVQADANRPFMVDAGEIQVRVVGTRFGVALEPQAIVIEVEEGTVQVSPRTAHRFLGLFDHSDRPAGITLHAGQRLRVPHGAQDPQTWQAETAPLAAPWRHGDLVFERESLGHVAARLQRYQPQPIHVDASVQSLQVSGRMRVRDVHSWLVGLSRVLPVQVNRLADGGIHIQARGRS